MIISPNSNISIVPISCRNRKKPCESCKGSTVVTNFPSHRGNGIAVVDRSNQGHNWSTSRKLVMHSSLVLIKSQLHHSRHLLLCPDAKASPACWLQAACQSSSTDIVCAGLLVMLLGAITNLDHV